MEILSLRRPASVYSLANNDWRIRRNLTLNLGIRYEYTDYSFHTAFSGAQLRGQCSGADRGFARRPRHRRITSDQGGIRIFTGNERANVHSAGRPALPTTFCSTTSELRRCRRSCRQPSIVCRPSERILALRRFWAVAVALPGTGGSWRIPPLRTNGPPLQATYSGESEGPEID